MGLLFLIMEYLHIKKLENYHPGYKDRNLQWCKAYFTMVNADPEFEMLEEIDKWRFLAFIMLELQTKKPIPLDEGYLTRKGLNLKKRPISLTIKMLQNFIEVVTEDEKLCVVEVDKEVEEEIEKRKKFVTEFFDYFLLKTKQNITLTPERKQTIEHRYRERRLMVDLKRAVDNFMVDDWEDRHKFMDLVYCIGIRNKIDNLEKWLNYKPIKKQEYHAPKEESKPKFNPEDHKKVSELIHKTVENMKKNIDNSK